MITINLHNLIFHSFHGVHEEEKVLGNSYVVDVAISFSSGEKISSLEQTVNYVSVYEIIKKRMQVPTALLETLAQHLADEIYDVDKRINSISITIEKKNPPIPNMQGSVSVNYKKDFS